MLRELFIHNIAIIEELALSFSPGLNVISGETGAGKSVIVGALGLLLGSRASSDILRTGCDRGLVTGAFDIDPSLQQKIAEFSIPDAEEDILVLSREISREGKNICRINEKIISLSGFRMVGALLLDIYGQSEERGLLLPANQLEILDQMGGSPLMEWKLKTREWSKKLKGLEKEIARQVRQEQEIKDKRDFLQFQLKELSAAELKDVNEEERLEEEIAILSGGELLAKNSMEVYGLLFGSETEGAPVYDKISRALGILEAMAGIDPSLGEKAAAVQELLYSVQDLSEYFRDYAESIQYNPQRLELLQDRLALIRRLQSKYRKSITELIAYREELAAVLDSQSFNRERIGELREQRDAAEAEYLQAAGNLSLLRKETGSSLAENVAAILRELGMKDARFETQFSLKESFGETGREEVQFVFSANAGEPLKPLQKAASGGELSRLMLALKSVLAEVDSVPVMVFDEADSGIGGETAGKVGRRIAQLASAHQVICVTHSAQVAVFADRHFLISKKFSEERTTAQVQQLSGRERIMEIARMLGGKELDTAVKHGEKMLEEARQQLKECRRQNV